MNEKKQNMDYSQGTKSFYYKINTGYGQPVHVHLIEEDNNTKEHIDKMQSRIKFLVSKKIIEGERKDLKQLLLKANKKSRDILSNRLEIEVGPSDALSIMGDTIKLIKIVEKQDIFPIY